MTDNRPFPQSYILKASRIYDFANEKPARGSDLFAPAPYLDNRAIIVRNGIIAAIAGIHEIPAGLPIFDAGNTAILPALFNCHVHLQLSGLRGKTTTGKGFANWLKSLVPLLLDILATGLDKPSRQKINDACESLLLTGTGHVGDIGGSLPGALTHIHNALKKNHVSATLFCEHFGFADFSFPWPGRCAAEIAANPAIAHMALPCGHALYSTHPSQLQKAHSHCRRANRPFSIHLAESPEETEMLASGTGPLLDYYKGTVLPPSWSPPLLAPLQYARKLGILTPGTLAVHGAQLAGGEIAAFAQTGAALCVCARSNANIGVGLPALNELIAADILLCLGTDGLVSAPDLDLRAEAAFLREHCNLPMQAVWRMAINNGAAAMHAPMAALVPGAPARFSFWPQKDWPD